MLIDTGATTTFIGRKYLGTLVDAMGKEEERGVKGVPIEEGGVGCHKNSHSMDIHLTVGDISVWVKATIVSFEDDKHIGAIGWDIMKEYKWIIDVDKKKIFYPKVEKSENEMDFLILEDEQAKHLAKCLNEQVIKKEYEDDMAVVRGCDAVLEEMNKNANFK
jgi:hypothetical protein